MPGGDKEFIKCLLDSYEGSSDPAASWYSKGPQNQELIHLVLKPTAVYMKEVHAYIQKPLTNQNDASMWMCSL